MRNLLAQALQAALRAVEEPSAPDNAEGGDALREARAGGPALQAAAAALETEARGAKKAPAARGDYLQRINAARRGLAVPAGAFPDDIAGARLVRGLMAAEEVLRLGRSSAPAPEEGKTPRATMVAHLVRILRRTPAFAADRERTLAVAKKLEAACLQAAVRACQETDAPHTRSWTSQAFVAAYSTRGGVLCRLLDPQSATCRAYGPVLAGRLLSGELRPEDTAGLAESALCPPALAAERAEIARRSEQRVQTKESAMFRCPHCGARRCTYQQVQRRSADEAPDFLCHCLGCERDFVGH
ncbi:MAG TPA: hypothetical protein VNI01_12790 [Elusimicrobiota bacterium]|nr:hypothetical protein [Elusimicrobiota bacterium]